MFLVILTQPVHLTLFECDFDEAGFEVTVDLIFFDSSLDDVIATVMKGPYLVFTEKAAELFGTTQSMNELATVSARSAPADSVLFQ